jgi:hypothetical protein
MSTNNKVKNNKEDEEGIFQLKYILAASVIGACIGNMFVVKKLRSISNIKPPPAASSYTSSSKTGPIPRSHYRNEDDNAEEPHYSNNNNDNYKYNNNDSKRAYDFIKKQQENNNIIKGHQFNLWRKSNYSPLLRPNISTFPTYLSTYLHLLDLKHQYPNQEEVKEGYRRMAMKNHPDKISNEDLNKQIKIQNFREATKGYNEIIKHLETFEKK